MPPKLAANLPALSIPFTSAFTPIVAAVEPVKNVLIPSAASTPLVSPENANSMSDESDFSCKPPVDVTLAEMPSIASSCCARLASVVSSSSPSRSICQCVFVCVVLPSLL